MPTEETHINIDDNSSDSHSSADLLRKIAAAVVGIIIIILVILLAKWLGDRIKERFVPGTTVIVPTVTATPAATPSGQVVYDPKTKTYKVSTISAIPSTGPNDSLYIFLAVMGIAGVSFLAVSKKISL